MIPHHFPFRESHFFSDPLAALERDAEIAEALIANLPSEASLLSGQALEAYRDLAQAEIDRRYDRLDRLSDDPLFMAEYAERARALQAALPIEEYIASEWPNIILERRGPRIRGRCPFLDCRDDHRSFTVYDGDFAWCTNCDRGGHVFRVIALCEGLDTASAQVRRATELVGEPIVGVPQHDSPCSQSLKRSGRKEQSRGERGVRVISGKVITS